MKPHKQARRFIAAEPDHPAARTLAALVLALEQETPFELAALYRLDLEQFEMALELLRDWRLERYIVGKARLLDMAVQLHELAGPPAAPAPRQRQAQARPASQAG